MSTTRIVTESGILNPALRVWTADLFRHLGAKLANAKHLRWGQIFNHTILKGQRSCPFNIGGESGIRTHVGLLPN